MSVDAVAEKVRQSLRANDCNLDICDLVPCFCAQRAATAALDAIEVTEEVVEAAARALAPIAWAALGTGDTLAQKNRRTASVRHARAALTAALAVWRR